MLLDSDDALHIVRMDLGNLIMQAKPEQKEVSLLGKKREKPVVLEDVD